MSKHLTDKPPMANKVKEGVSDACSRLIVRLMQKQREKRVQTAHELAAQFEELLTGKPETGTQRAVTARTSGPRPRVATSTREKAQTAPPASSANSLKRLFVAVGAGAVLAVIASVAVVALRGKQN